ncbi:unnamed protein product [Penicillium salamii]|uniref:Uncharacterized protein n=2 Tax=Penicillium TaxID=5073 RepID=A0A9W4IQX3_9EURO|nr:hypothetical protein HAV15_004925 [Penicillium sp. str. \
MGGEIDSATTIALLQVLVKARRFLGVVQHAASQNTQILGVVERLGSLLLDIKELHPEQWGSLENGVITAVFSLLYCCIMECYELRPTPLAISSLGNQLDACNLALQCVYGAAIMDHDDRRWVCSQQQKVMEAVEQMDNKRAKYLDELKQPEPVIYHSQAILELLKEKREPNRAARFEGMRVSFSGENRGIQAAEYHGSMGRFTFPL